MCIAIAKPKGRDLTKDELFRGFAANSHGAGFAYPKDDRVEIEKGFFDFDEFLNALRKAQEKYDNPAMLIHCRYASHGVKNKDNCHPFPVANDLAVIHNGIMPSHYQSLSKVDNVHSDTWHFIEEYLKPLLASDDRFYKSEEQIAEITKHISGTRTNKLCFLDSSGYISIVNESAGYWQDGIWHSNASCHASKFNANPALIPASQLKSKSKSK